MPRKTGRSPCRPAGGPPYCRTVIVRPDLTRNPRASDATVDRPCDHPGCSGSGVFRAPRSRDKLRDYFHFCLEHVRAYNAGWDFYRGMSTADIERARRQDTVWQRPTWRFGSGPAASRATGPGMRDPFGMFGEDEAPAAPQSRRWPPRSPEAEAVSVLGVDDDVSLAELKIRYKALVKLYHPDANGGSCEAEERLKRINQAYRTLSQAIASR